jgi:hypothetical protein
MGDPMLDIVKVALDLVGSQISLRDILDRREKRDINQIGLFLLELYNKSGDIVDEGYSLIKGLQHLVARHAYYFSCGASHSVMDSARHLHPSLVLQAANLHHFIQVLHRNFDLIEIINPHAFSNLRDEFERKRLLVFGLAGLLYPEAGNDLQSKAGSLQITWLEMELDRASTMPRKTESASVELAFIEAITSRARHSSDGCRVGSLPWDESMYKLVKLYLESGLATTRLEQVSSARQSLRDSILDQFDLKQLLLTAGRARS